MQVPLRVFVVAGEASGDRLGADLIHAIRERRHDVVFAGIGGKRMEDLGVPSAFDIAELSVLGFVEGLKAYPRVVKRVADTITAIELFNPDVVVLIDSWGFTIRVAQALKKARSRARIVKYLGPQVWASRPGRAKTLAQFVDHLICIYDIERPYYAPFNLPCTVVGNPVANAPFTKGDGGLFRAKFGISADAPVLLVLFGSRPSEVRRLGAVFIATALAMRQQMPNLQIATFAAATVRESVVELMKAIPDAHIATEEADKENAFSAATGVLACSGSVTTELALQGAPMVVAYRLGAITWFLAKNFLFKPKYVTLMNIAVNREIIREYLQERCTSENLRTGLMHMFRDPVARQSQIDAQYEALDLMGRGKPSAASVAADVVLAESLKV